MQRWSKIQEFSDGVNELCKLPHYSDGTGQQRVTFHLSINILFLSEICIHEWHIRSLMILSGLKASVFLFVIQIHPCLTSPLCICVLFNANLMMLLAYIGNHQLPFTVCSVLYEPFWYFTYIFMNRRAEQKNIQQLRLKLNMFHWHLVYRNGLMNFWTRGSIWNLFDLNCLLLVTVRVLRFVS